MEEIRGWLDPDEVDYGRAARLGPDALPLLHELAQGSDVMLASKAAYLASLIGGEGSMAVLTAAARHSEPAVRVAAASGLRNLEESALERLAEPLLDDEDVGVRKVALHSVAGFESAPLRERVQRMAQEDPEPAIRELAARVQPS
jgi:HEAT repeat protein